MGTPKSSVVKVVHNGQSVERKIERTFTVKTAVAGLFTYGTGFLGMGIPEAMTIRLELHPENQGWATGLTMGLTHGPPPCTRQPMTRPPTHRKVAKLTHGVRHSTLQSRSPPRENRSSAVHTRDFSPLDYHIRIELCRLKFDTVRLHSRNRVKD